MGFHSYGQARKKVKFWKYYLGFCYFSSSNFNLKTLHRLFVFKQKIYKKTKINRKIGRGAHLETLHAPKCDQILSFFNFFLCMDSVPFFLAENLISGTNFFFYHAIEFNKRDIHENWSIAWDPSRALRIMGWESRIELIQIFKKICLPESIPNRRG